MNSSLFRNQDNQWQQAFHYSIPMWSFLLCSPYYTTREPVLYTFINMLSYQLFSGVFGATNNLIISLNLNSVYVILTLIL